MQERSTNIILGNTQTTFSHCSHSQELVACCIELVAINRCPLNLMKRISDNDRSVVQNCSHQIQPSKNLKEEIVKRAKLRSSMTSKLDNR